MLALEDSRKSTPPHSKVGQFPLTNAKEKKIERSDSTKKSKCGRSLVQSLLSNDLSVYDMCGLIRAGRVGPARPLARTERVWTTYITNLSLKNENAVTQR